MHNCEKSGFDRGLLLSFLTVARGPRWGNLQSNSREELLFPTGSRPWLEAEDGLFMCRIVRGETSHRTHRGLRGRIGTELRSSRTGPHFTEHGASGKNKRRGG
jgi:hypothetical protein